MKYEIAIVGGGLVGAALACILGERRLRIALVESRPTSTAPAPDDPFDCRVSAVSRSSERVLRRIAVWPMLPAERLGAYREMHVWDADGGGEIHFDSADLGEPTLGHIAENRVLQAGLEARLADLDTVDWLRPASLDEMDVRPDRALLRVDGTRVETRLVVGADGTDSRVRSLAGLSAPVDDYGQRAVVATVKTERDHQDTAWQRFLPSGPLAFLPLPDGYSSVVWSTAPAHAQTLSEMPEAEFASALTDAFDARLGEVIEVVSRADFPLRRLHSEHYVAERVALVGDAAHTIHPLAGQGVNLGWMDAAALAEVLETARNNGSDPGVRQVLRRYERWRKGHNTTMLAAVDGFNWLFAHPAPPVRTARNFGLNLTDRFVPAKHLLMRQAMGLSGDLPAMAR